jgi:ribonuclease HIII
VIEGLLEKVPNCPRALSDQFANPAVLQKALQTRGQNIELIQRTKAESDPAVAAASILAREAFVKWLDRQGSELGMLLAKGVSPLVKEHAKQIFQKKGLEGLSVVAKMHFRTSNEIMQAQS